MNLGDIRSTRLIIFKGVLFVFLGVLAGSLVVLNITDVWWERLIVLAVCIWAFCRAYYFAFYVITNYVDPSFKYAGITSAVRYLFNRK
ncbi:MAG: hypothetical protein H6815_01110 [Phycisphaeraceae bacterium]|nr:hypothetical protein [Phycisphaerales bacterium]MCB9859025.1 hypothetical protein [Phycisphaeraceae bacterium]